MRNQVSLYSWTQRRLTLAEQPLSLELSTFNYRLLGNDGATRWHHTLNFVDGFLTATFHSDGFEGTAAVEHTSYIRHI